MTDDIFQQGVAAAKTGDLETACKFFSLFVKQNPQSENGWLALGACLSDVEKKEICFKKVLSLNPANEKARQLLQGLQKTQVAIIEEEAPGEPLVEKDRLKTEGLKLSQSLPLLIGFFVGLFLVGGLLMLTIGKNPPAIFDEFAKAIVPPPEDIDSSDQISTDEESGSPTWIPISTPSPSGNPFVATPSPSGSVSEYFKGNYDKVLNAIRLMNNENYGEAIIAWDEIIRIIPEYADAYNYRGVCYLKLTHNQRILMDYINHSQKAYDDFTKAIELGPPKGHYYGNRAKSLVQLAEQYEFQVDKAPLYQQILEDYIQAYMLGSGYPWISRDVGEFLEINGRCEEALDFLLRLVDERGENATPSASINNEIAGAYVCMGQFEKALDYIEKAVSIWEEKGEDTQWYQWRQVQILISLERYSEAFEIIDEMIEESPHYAGWRYYERAYLHYRQGETELAYQDLNEGSGNTWLQYDMRAYVLALLALEEGDEDSGLYWLQIAEASLSKYSLPHIYKDTLEEIDRLGGSYLFPTPTPSLTPLASPTPIPAIPDHIYFTPTPAYDMGTAELVNYSGTGIYFWSSGSERTFLFRPEGYHDFSSIESLKLKITAEVFSPGVTQISSYFMLLDGSGLVGPIPLFLGENEITNPNKVVSNAGYFYVTLKNDYVTTLLIEDISVQIIAKEADGTTAVYGYE